MLRLLCDPIERFVAWWSGQGGQAAEQRDGRLGGSGWYSGVEITIWLVEEEEGKVRKKRGTNLSTMI
jgi:hypothetical protein